MIIFKKLNNKIYKHINKIKYYNFFHLKYIFKLKYYICSI